MELLDTTIVNVAIPSIEAGLHATPAQIQWIVATYILAFAVLLITGGRLGDAFGRRRTFLAGVGGFAIMSLAAGLAQSADQLVAARVGQGVFAALTIPQVLASIRATFPVGEHAKAYGLYGAFVGLATVSGPLLGGLLVDADLFDRSWRPIFLVNVPIGIAAVIGALMYLPESTSPEKERFDLVCVGLLTGALLLVIYPLVQGAGDPWTVSAVGSSSSEPS
jgi:MFS family permease